ncbi:hypothetical protein [Alienimonas chondri]|uniref:DUF3592 domain-containing protein n=1 Tax=Alienimonas chondri TaxID=2681879 RepID=A0ABX1VKX7_9PLAN|nr:hypothetical protein [Alienimonas chondri]NNJ27788.1 hypothetical protein [Alienimonas chondri]
MEFAYFLPVLAFVVGLRIANHFFDQSRITQTVEEAGGTVQDISWEPFARGWWGEKGERHYQVWYRTAEGRVTGRRCNTSMLTGVYWADDRPLAADRPTAPRGGRTRAACDEPLKRRWKLCPQCGEPAPPR